MLKPSYAQLMDVLNKGSKENVTSRYSVVIAAAKRARQLIDGDEPMVFGYTEDKPLSTAVAEIEKGKIKIVPVGEGTVLNLHKDQNIEEELLNDLKKETKEEKVPTSFEENETEVEEVAEDETTEE